MNSQFTAIVQKLAAERGKDVLLNFAVCKALLADYTRGEYNRESRVLLQAVESDVAKTIAETTELEACKTRMVQRLQEEHFLSREAAADTVGLLTLVLRGDAPGNLPVKKKPVFCIECGTELAEGVKFCGNCGKKQDAGPPRCGNCGAELAGDVKFCTECGTETAAAETAPQTEAAPQTENAPVKAAAAEKDGKALKAAVGAKNAKLLTAAFALEAVLDGVTDKSLPYEIAAVIKKHAKGASVAAMASAWIPAAGGAAATAAVAGFVWSMYAKLNKKINLTMSKQVLKTLAAGAVTNVAAGAAGSLVGETVLSAFWGLGSIAASALGGVTAYAMTLASGFVYLKILTKLFKEGKDPAALSADALKGTVNEIMKNENMKEILQEAKAEYKQAKESGELDKKETVELEEDE